MLTIYNISLILKEIAFIENFINFPDLEKIKENLKGHIRVKGRAYQEGSENI